VRAGVPWARLRRFFSNCNPVSLPEAAALFGCDPGWLIAQLDPIAVPHPEEGIPWAEMAVLVREIFTLAELDAVAGTMPGFPSLLRVSSVEWRLPTYLLIALEHLVADERAASAEASRLTVEAYVARQLSDLLDMDVFDRLSLDPAFRAARHFPEEDE
jgi:hypothetical protein